MIQETQNLATFQGTQLYQPHTRQAHYFTSSIPLMAGAGALYLVYSLMRPVLRPTPVTRRDRGVAAEIIRLHGSSSIAYFALGHDKSYFFNDDGSCLIAYTLVRDVALAASGLLSPKLGGPPVYPPIPEGVMGQGQVKRVWAVSQGEDRFRRGIYTFVYRATPPPSLNVFDAPDGFSTCTRRLRSNTPLQALTLMNDSGFFECAAALEKIIRQDGLATAFRRCTARPPQACRLLQR